MNRRELLKAIAAGGVITAAGLWMPGSKLISIPNISRIPSKAQWIYAMDAANSHKEYGLLVSMSKSGVIHIWDEKEIP
jgi:hypothetical protein